MQWYYNITWYYTPACLHRAARIKIACADYEA
jgi:hypothetical protein